METSAQASTTSVQSTTTADATSVHTIMAHEKSCVIAPMLSRSTFNAPVNLNIYSDRDHTERNSAVDYEHVKSVLMKHKTRLRKKFKFICEGDSKIEHKTLFRQIYTGLFITEKKSRMEKECDHEVHQIERKCSTQSKHYTPINCNDIFVEIPKLRLNTGLKEEVEGAVKEEEDIRTVLTKGIAGIGKTVSVQKFIVDWAEEKANHHIDLMLVMPFRELNVVEADKFSLCKLICIFNPELKDLPKQMYEELKIVFILDGLDEFYSPLNFHQKLVSDIIELSTVDILITNLIKGILLPTSHIWITSRPVAADQIPSQYISRLTEVQGFNDLQKEEYFRKKIGDEAQANKIISHIKTSHSLYIMCHIPVFCWITATLLQQILNEDGCTEIPKTLTEMYTHFLFIQTRIKNQKYDQKEVNDPKHLMTSNKGVILKLAELAFKQLVKGKVIFSEEDLRECGIDLTEASVYSGICTEIFKEESVLYETKLYCFVHLSFQEFLAAVHVLNCYLNKNMEALQFFMHETNAEGHSEGVPLDNISLEELLKRAVNKALQSQNGHLDLFLRFLLGISLETNQKYLQGLLTVKNNNSKSIKKTIRYIQNRIRGDDDFGRKRMANMNADSSINLYLCLTEMNDQSLHRDVQNYLESSEHSEYLSPAHCSAIAYMLQISENVLDELDLKKYNTSEEGYRRLVPAVSRCKKALFAGCCLNEQSCGTVGTVLQLKNIPLKELDLSRNNLQDSGVKLLCDGLRSSYCKLELLRLLGCNLSEQSCENLATALLSASTSLKELDLSYNDLKDSGVRLLSAGLRTSHCKLEILRLAVCNLTEKSGEILALSLQSPTSLLKELELSNNDLHDSGIKLLSCGLKNSHSKLEILRLSGCLVTDDGCSGLRSALSSNHSRLRVLDLSYNHLQVQGVELLTAVVDDPQSTLETFRMLHCGEFRIKPGLKKYACNLTLDPNTAHTYLSLSEGNRKVRCLREEQSYHDHTDRFDCRFQVLSNEVMSGRSYWEIEYCGDTDIAATYKGICKKGRSRKCRFGYNTHSWRISCYSNSYSACHDDKSVEIPAPASHSNRVGVYLDWPAGTLSFYNISADSLTLTHIYTFYSTFTEPLFAGFGFTYDSVVYLAQMD